MAEDQKKPTPYESGPLSPAQIYELELSSRAQVEFLQIRPAVIGELVREYGATDYEHDPAGPRCAAKFEGERCAYAPLHAGVPHWAITESGEVTWTEESLAMHEVATQLERLADAVRTLAEKGR